MNFGDHPCVFDSEPEGTDSWLPDSTLIFKFPRYWTGGPRSDTKKIQESIGKDIPKQSSTRAISKQKFSKNSIVREGSLVAPFALTNSTAANMIRREVWVAELSANDPEDSNLS